MKGTTIISSKSISCVLTVAFILFAGCDTAYFKQRFGAQTQKQTETDMAVQNVSETEHTAAETLAIPVDDSGEAPVSIDQAAQYEVEQKILEDIYICYEEAIAAHADGNLGLAETKIEDAILLLQEVDLVVIEDESMVMRFKDAAIIVAQELGKILHESSIIAEEDPMAWLSEVNAEQFKSGQWTDDELQKIVLKIAVTADIPIEFNKQVRNMIYYFQNNGRDDMAKWMRRSGRFIPMMQEILAEEGIPLDMVYLSMIESGFSPRAYSRARAVGLWQFMYSTGKIYGLDRNQWIDERRDPIKATRAAARHLNDLYKSSDDWNIVMAMYNSGPLRIRRQLRQTENIEFWDLSLPRETRNYVPSFMAAVVIAKAPELFGFDNIEKEPPFEFDTVEVYGYTNLNTAAKCAGCDVATLKELNPELLTDRVPMNVETYELRVPKGNGETFTTEFAKLPVEKYVPPQVTTYRVRRGDTFSGIADKFRTSMARLRDLNPQVTNINRLRVGQTINLIASSTSSAQQTFNVSRADAVGYTIRRGDTLGKIAERNGTTIRTLQALNNMGTRTRIYVGRRLLIPKNTDNTSTAQTQRTAEPIGNARISYVVKKNDTLYEIGQKYGVSHQRIMEINQIKDHRKIKPGQTIVISQ